MRIAGDNRYETSCKVAVYLCGLEAKDGSGAKAFGLDRVYLATGQSFPDATISGIASGQKKTLEGYQPIVVLSDPKDSNDEVVKLMSGQAPYDNNDWPYGSDYAIDIYTVGHNTIDYEVIFRIGEALGIDITETTG